MKTLWSCALIPVSAVAFVARHSPSGRTTTASPRVEGILLAAVAGEGSEWNDDDDQTAAPMADPPSPSSAPKRRRQQQVVMSPAIPFLECPPVLVDCEMAGNVGFDPLGFAKTKEDLTLMRESEIRHARLSMLVCGSFRMLATVFFISRHFVDPAWILLLTPPCFFNTPTGCRRLALERTLGSSYCQFLWTRHIVRCLRPRTQ